VLFYVLLMIVLFLLFFFFNDPATTGIYTLPLHEYKSKTHNLCLFSLSATRVTTLCGQLVLQWLTLHHRCMQLSKQLIFLL